MPGRPDTGKRIMSIQCHLSHFRRDTNDGVGLNTHISINILIWIYYRFSDSSGYIHDPLPSHRFGGAAGQRSARQGPLWRRPKRAIPYSTSPYGEIHILADGP